MQVEHIPFLRFFHHKKIHGENSSSILPSYTDTFSLVANKRKSHIPNRNLGMALILTVNSNHPVLLGLIADSLHLSLWMLFPIHRITWSTMAGCLRFAIWLCILFKLFFPSTNQASHRVACLFAFKELTSNVSVSH